MADVAAQLAEILAERFPPGQVIVTNPAEWFDPPSERDIEFQLGWWAALTMIATVGGSGLTEREQGIIDNVGRLAEDYIELVGDGPTSAADFAEILPHLHALQQTVMAQAAARTHPGRYRELGGTLHDE